MTALQKALHDMRAGNTVAAVAVMTVLEQADEWPVNFRDAALREYGLGPYEEVA